MLTRKLDNRRGNTQFIIDVIDTLNTISRHGLVQRGLGVVTQAHVILFKEGKGSYRTYDSANGVLVISVQPDEPPFRTRVERILGGPAKVVHADNFGTVYKLKEN